MEPFKPLAHSPRQERSPGQRHEDAFPDDSVEPIWPSALTSRRVSVRRAYRFAEEVMVPSRPRTSSAEEVTMVRLPPRRTPRTWLRAHFTLSPRDIDGWNDLTDRMQPPI